MGEVVQLGAGYPDESLLDFLKREGPVRTDSVANRFGWTLAAARGHLRLLEQKGHIVSRLETVRGRRSGGRIYGWSIVPATGGDTPRP
ncbi:FaeA/PapI family transcriptional regulator [Bosea sp. RAC05]|uniref:FaeA/PapI family transcriptional regulator n=1 Tax=Bosea sp. RAC05 TaxID=1842539 RepID=UPI00083DB006|nr:FaeA/PapI family transcriptional regulator [Bosea sp. RAC05]AOG03298.1 faeA-like family protein [Bosea sp. RAC05]